MSTEDLAPFPGQEVAPEIAAAIDREERFVPGPAGDPDVRVLLYRRKDATTRPPLIVDIHGGAFARRADNFPATAARLAMLARRSCRSTTGERLRTHSRGGVEDCYAALCWAAADLDVDAGRVAVTGASAGGALAAAVTLLARDRGGPAIAFQALVIPVIDDRCDTPAMRHTTKGRCSEDGAPKRCGTGTSGHERIAR